MAPGKKRGKPVDRIRPRDSSRRRSASKAESRPGIDFEVDLDRPAIDLSESFSQLDDGIPVLFLPVRLETRFTDATESEARKLRVRIYPDQIHLDDHSREISEREKKIGELYWAAWAAAKKDLAAKANAREWLASRLPARRAAWVAHQTNPKHQGDRKKKDEIVSGKAHQGRARCLPDRWAVIGYTREADGSLAEAFVRWTRPVEPELRLSLDPNEYDAWSSDGQKLPVDPGMSWMVDYESAVSAGMALTIDLSKLPQVAASGVAVLLVVGVSAQTPAAARRELADLLEAHQYADGLAFAPQGTPTNNTDEADSGWSFREPDPTSVLARELDAVGTPEVENSNAHRLAWALGDQQNSSLARIEHATTDEESGAEAMNRVMWPLTWGQYFDHLLANSSGESAVPNHAVASFRDRFIGDVRGGAPLPSVRIGAQPYGVLPVRFSQTPQAWPDDSLWFEHITLRLRSVWAEAATTRVPRFDPVLGASGGSSQNDPDSVLSEILSTLPHPKRYLLRELHNWRDSDQVSPSFLEILFLAPVMPYLYFDDPTFGYEALSVLGRWGWALDRLTAADGYSISANDIRPIDNPATLGNAEAQLQELASLRGRINGLVRGADDRAGARAWIDYMSSMVEQHRDRYQALAEFGSNLDFSGIIANEVDDPALFYSLYERDEDTSIFSHPLVNSTVMAPSQYLEILRSRVPGVLSPNDRGDDIDIHIDPRRRVESGTKPQRRSVRAASRRLTSQLPTDFEEAGIPTGSTAVPPAAFHQREPLLYQLLDGVVDDVSPARGASYRAALSTLAALSPDVLELRLRETLGLASHRLDAYVTSMARRRLGELRDRAGSGVQVGGFGWVVDLVPDKKAALDSQGFIHAPSLQQATTAAILRSGWSVHGTKDADSTMAVDLRSDRMRIGSWLLDGIRQGQSLSELLGFRFERGLHDAGLDQWIDPVRRAVLLGDGTERAPRGPVDGLALLELYRAESNAKNLVAEVAPEYLPKSGSPSDITQALDSLAAALDAAGDAAITESVHQVAQGNMTRAAATLDAINQGDVAPPELRGLRTPTGGVGVTNRIAVLLGTESGSEWAHAAPRALLDPALESWVAHLLPPPTLVHYRTRRVGPTGPTPWEAHTLDELNLSALDAIFEGPIGGLTIESRWGRRICHLEHAATTAHDFSVEIETAPESEDGVSLAEFAEAASAIRALVARARPMNARDLVSPERATDAGTDAKEAETRVNALEPQFRARTAALRKHLPESKATELDPRPRGSANNDQLRGAMLGLSGYDFAGAIPTTGWLGTDEDTSALWDQAWALGESAAKRVAQLDALVAKWRVEDESGLPSTDKRIKRVKLRLEQLAGRAFPLLPRFSIDNGAEVAAAFGRGEQWTAPDRGLPSAFLSQVARVRPESRLLEEARSVSELLVNSTRVEFLIAQEPVVDGDEWAAVSAPRSGTGGRVCWLVTDHGGMPMLKANRGVGMVVDEWTERIPNTDQVTGVAFHFDAPSSRAPQSMLLAVTPDDDARWSFELVLSTLLQTLEDLQLRSVSPQTLGAYGHHLPAIFSPRRIYGSGATPS